MKKIITSLMVLAAAFTAAAQNFTITGAGDATYADGAVINVGYTVPRPGKLGWDPELMVHINKVSSILGDETSLSATAEASVPEIVSFCGLGSACTLLSETPVTKRNNYKVGNIAPLAIDITARAENITEPIEVKVTVSDGKETVNLTLNFLPVPQEEAGINGPQSAGNAIRVAHRSLSYTLTAAAQLTVYNISGRAVIDRRISGSGSLNLAALPAGVYVYRLGNATGKFLLR